MNHKPNGSKYNTISPNKYPKKTLHKDNTISQQIYL